MVAYLLGLSIVIQVAAAVLALRLIWVTRRSLAWILICCALLLMSARRCITLYGVLAGWGDEAMFHGTLLSEALVSVGISLAMVCGVALIAPLFQSIQRSREEIRRREEDLRVTLGSIAEGVVTCGTDLRVAGMNPAAEQVTGWSADDATGRLVVDVLPLANPDEPDRLQDPFDPVLRDGTTVRLERPLQLRRKDGGHVLVQGSGAPIRDARGGVRGAVIALQDVTRQQQIEETLRHAQKLETVGRLAGGIAHDFNNALCGILGYGELLTMKTPKDSPLRGYAASIVETAHHSRELTSRLLTFSRKGRVMTRPMDIHDSVRLVADLLLRTIDKDLKVDLHLDARDTTLQGDASQIHNALLNLAVNARDATPSGGRVTFATRNVSFDEPSADAMPPIPPGRYVEVAIEDTGVGMGPEVMAHLFEPFFTTKPSGQGTGLGLSAVYGVVRDHNGVIRVESRLGEGSVFRVYLPLSEGEVAAVAVPTAERLRGLGTILIADDDKILRRLGAELLAEMGYETLVAEDGLKAVQALRGHEGRIDLVLMDMVMPEMNGLDALREMRKIRPDIPVVFMSGYETEILREGLREERIDGFLQKPYGMAELAHAVSEAVRRG